MSDIASPTIRFVGGSPSDEEIAAVTAVVLARAAADGAAGASSDAPPPQSMWGRPAHVRHGRPRSWGESALPR